MNTRRPLAAVAAILVAATALASCADGGGRGAPEADNVAATPTVSATVAAPAAPKYIDVTGQGRELPRDSVDRAQFSATPQPGAKVLRWNSAGVGDRCTLGPAVTVGSRSAFLTAGHCAGAGVTQFAQGDAAGKVLIPLGPAVQAVNEDGVPGADGILDDRALIFTSTPPTPQIAGTWTVAGSLTVKETQRLPHGTPICVDGATSGVRCGGLISAERGRVEFVGKPGTAAPSKGDSGAPVFVVDDSGRATVIGLVTSEARDGSTTNATFIEPALLSLGAELVTAS
ncbi:Uncharacterised protein (plasmid) [Tsukamurella tyrosinosolvens]|uniref:Trypsin n=1 Tax=Tsukamurella tyrosinosolvens TaxID=57704 RepID=A0A1H4VFX6_TSUTY|nr:hypothetical protein [Tsukamurella tyrosinosolvens]KXO90986.1 hypothetical protein AXK58_21380 [Tsukamurella tyrosinosolvens]SEC79999.1 hypothetical protein SAMN04489793_3218 [Tsukamurella tyrosinosolvens]VEH90538.1 Uncharacterised protein [Tsukamurella tyrosinosolvens]